MKKPRVMAAILLTAFGGAVLVVYSLWGVGNSLEGLLSPEVLGQPPAEPQSSSESAELREVEVDLEPEMLVAEELTGADVRRADSPMPQSVNDSSVPVFSERRCFFAAAYGFVAVRMMGGSELSLPFGYHMSLTDTALKNLADSDEDGLAQYVYAHRILDLGVVPGHVFISPEVVSNRFESIEDEDFQIATEYMISAVRNKNWGASERLAAMYFPFNQVESHAWLLVNAMAGGNGLQIGPRSADAKRQIVEQLDTLSQEEEAASFTRAIELVAEYELADGLLPLDECMGADQP